MIFWGGLVIFSARAVFSDDSSALQRGIRTVFRHGFKCTGRQLHGNELFQLADPDALLLEIRLKGPGYRLGDVLADAAFFLGETATVNLAAFGRLGLGDAA